MKKRFIIRFSQALLIFFCALSISCHKEKEDKEKITVTPPVKVTVIEVSPGLMINNRVYSGTVSSASTTSVSFSVAGTITELYAREGQKVNKGQLLGKVRSGEYQNAYNIASAQLAEAQDGYDRLKKLHDANALPEVKWVEMEQKLKQAQNTVEMAKRTLDDTNLYSPASGTITEKFADVGQTILPVEPIYQIVATNDLEINVSVSENEIGSFSDGDKAMVTFESIGTSPIEGKVTQKTVVADPITRSYTVKVAFQNPDGNILPGMIGNVTFESGDNHEEEQGITLPSQAVLLNDDNRWFVWIANDSVAERRFVTALLPSANGVVVTSGLNKGDKVIVQGMQKVGTGTRIVY